MTLWITFFVISTLFLSLAGVLSEVFFRRSPVLQDTLLRTTLLAIVILPLLLLMRPWTARVVLPTYGIVESREDVSFLTDLPEERQDSVASTSMIKESNPLETSQPAKVSEPTSYAFRSSHALSKNRTSETNIGLQINPAKENPRETGSSSKLSQTPSDFIVASLPPDSISLSKTGMAILKWTLLLGTAYHAIVFLLSWYRLIAVTRLAKVLVNSPWIEAVEKYRMELGLRRLEIRISEHVATPMLGAGTNRILIPEWLEESDDREMIEQIIRHEAIHLQRRDGWYHWLLGLLGVVLWMNPLFYWMKGRMVWLREIICDAHVAEQTNPIEYAQTLLNLTRSSTFDSRSRSFRLAVSMASRRSQLAQRIEQLLQATTFEPMTHRSRGMQAKVSGMAIFVCLAVCLCRFGTAELEAATSSDDEKTIRGTVTLANGQPANAASVYLWKRVSGGVSLPIESFSTKTDAKGAFHFSKVENGKYIVWAETRTQTNLDGFLKGYSLELKTEEDYQKSIELKTHESCRYTVRTVSKETGMPVPGAHISFGWTDIPRDYVTNADGLVGISGLAKNDWYFVVRADGFGMEQRKVPAQPNDAKVDLVFELGPGTKVKGSVVDEEGMPVVGAKLYANSREDGAMSVNYAELKSDAQGKYLLTSIPFDKLIRISADAEGFLRESTEFRVLNAEEPDEVKIVLKRRPYGGDCMVTVVDESGNPIAGATIANTGNSSNEVRQGTTDEHGTARIADLYGGFRGYLAFVRAPGYVAQEVQLKHGSKEAPGEIQVIMKLGKKILGRLIDPDGNPVPNIRVYYNKGEQPWTTGGVVTTKADGRFEIDGLPDYSTFTFYTQAPFAPIQDRVLPVGNEEEVLVGLEYEAVLRVVAIDDDTGKAIPEFNVKLNFPKDRKPGDVVRGITSSLVDPGTDILGEVKEFRLGHLEPGTPFQVTVSAQGYEKKVIGRVEAELEKESEPIQVRLQPEDKALIVKVGGILKDKEGNPVAGVQIQLVTSDNNPKESDWVNYRWDSVRLSQCKDDPQCKELLTTSTDKSGRFTFPMVQLAQFMELFCFGGDYANFRYVICDPAQPELKTSTEQWQQLKLVVPKGGQIRANLSKDQFPEVRYIGLEYVTFETSDACFGSIQQNLDKNQSGMTFKGLPAGKYRIVFYGPDEPVQQGFFTRKPLGTQTIEIEEGESIEVEF